MCGKCSFGKRSGGGQVNDRWTAHKQRSPLSGQEIQKETSSETPDLTGPCLTTHLQRGYVECVCVFPEPVELSASVLSPTDSEPAGRAARLLHPQPGRGVLSGHELHHVHVPPLHGARGRLLVRATLVMQ